MPRFAICIATVLALGSLAGCGDPTSPEAQVRSVIGEIEAAAEARDVGDFMQHVSPQFRDEYTRGPDELAQYVRGYFITNQSIHLLTRIDNIEFPTADEARASVTVGMLGRESAESWDVAAEIRDFDVTFMREGDEWKVTHVRIRGGEVR